MIHGSMIDWGKTISRNTIGGMEMDGNMMGSNMMGSNMMGSNIWIGIKMSCNSSFGSYNKLNHENKKVRSLSCIYFQSSPLDMYSKSHTFVLSIIYLDYQRRKR